MTIPLSDDHLRLLALLVGNWEIEERIQPSLEGAAPIAASGLASNSLVLRGTVLLSDHEQRIEGKVRFRGHGIYECDRTTGEVTFRWWDTATPQDLLFRGRLEGTPSPGQVRATDQNGSAGRSPAARSTR